MKPKPIDANIRRYNRAFDRLWKALDQFARDAEDFERPLRRVVYTTEGDGVRYLRVTNRRSKAKGSK